MSSPSNQPVADQKLSLLGRLWRFVRNRLVAGLMVALPVAITFFIIYWLYSSLRQLVIDPIAHWLLLLYAKQLGAPAVAEGAPDWFVQFQQSGQLPEEAPSWFQQYLQSQQPTVVEQWVAPLVAVFIVLLLLYLFGMFFQSRLHRMIDALLLHVPGVTTIYKAVRNVFVSLQQSQAGMDRFKRVVLVEFPHPGMKVPAFVTSTCKDNTSERNILCVYVPTTPVPTSGYMLMVPEENVVDLSWDLNETLQAIVSGGISVPETVDYDKKDSRPDSGSPPRLNP